MFERFTSEARSVVISAQEEARALGHDYIGTEHLVLGLLKDDAGKAADVLADAGVTLEKFRREVVTAVGAADCAPLTDHDAKALRSLGIDLDEVRSRVEDTFGPGALTRPTSRRKKNRSHIPFTRRAKDALASSLIEAKTLRHRHLGPDHILLGLLRDPDALGTRLLEATAGSAGDLTERLVSALRRAS